MTELKVALLGFCFTLLGVVIGKVWTFAERYTQVTNDMEQLREDFEEERVQALLQRNNIGDKVRQQELKLFYVAMMVTPEAKLQEILNALVRRLT